jgi:hypothetical protein
MGSFGVNYRQRSDVPPPKIEYITVPKDQFEKLCDDVCDLKTAVCGNKEFRIKGLLNEVIDLKSWRDTMAAKITLLTGIVTGAIWAIKFILTGDL